MSPLQPAEREAALQLIEWSLREDLAGQVDVTSTVLIPEREWARVDVVRLNPRRDEAAIVAARK